ncbi:anaphase promoting complex subunit 8 [Terfezia claveryi]|nr:anaphase promoting complex subunit 8 [Terfezia claveryi]
MDTQSIHTALMVASQKCSERCLYQSAKWLAEAFNSLPKLDPPSKPPSSYPFTTTFHPPASPSPKEAQLEFTELPTYLLAKTYFDCREFDRCFSTLKDCKSSKSRFLCHYARYMAGEKRKEEEMEMVLGPLDGAPTPNREILPVINSLEAIFTQWRNEGKIGREKEEDSWLYYLHGILLAKHGNEAKAKEAYEKSIRLYPWNWGAWVELGQLIGTLEELCEEAPKLPDHLIKKIWHLQTTVELYQSSEVVQHELTQLEITFPNMPFLKTQRALLYYHARDFEEAEQVFDTLLKADPHRLDALDHYSNILYVMERRPKLAFLAQLATSTDRFRPETCCVVGNYYSLKSEHEKAVMYFRRALTLDRSFLSAWTLMGHEYVEMKNTHAAIEAYRRAVDVNRKDYRAWYGLGLSYEVLEMHYYALFYFQRAASLRPYDAQMWQAMGSCFDHMNRPQEAIKAYKRALVASSHTTPGEGGSFDPTTLYSIGLMYEKTDNPKEAAKYMDMCVNEDVETPATNKAKMWLARWEFGNGNWKKAGELANELCQDGPEIEEAKALVRDLRARMEAMGGTNAGGGGGGRGGS